MEKYTMSKILELVPDEVKYHCAKKLYQKRQKSIGPYLGKRIGSGGGGDLFILEGITGPKYVVKKIKYIDPLSKAVLSLPMGMRKKMSMKSQIKGVRNEIKIQIIASYLGIAPKILTYTDEFIVMEYIDGVTLWEYLKNHDYESVSQKIENAINKMHDAGIVHNDLIAENIIISRDNKVYIIDFGLSEYNPNFTEEAYVHDYLII